MIVQLLDSYVESLYSTYGTDYPQSQCVPRTIRGTYLLPLAIRMYVCTGSRAGSAADTLSLIRRSKRQVVSGALLGWIT